MIPTLTTNLINLSYDAALAQTATLDGGPSEDSAGVTISDPACLITQFEFILLAKPSGAADPVVVTSGTLDSVLTVPIPAGFQGTFFYLLKIYEGANASSTTLIETPNSAFGAIHVGTDTLSLNLMAEGERNYGDRINENWNILDNAITALQLLVGAGVTLPVATNLIMGISKLNEVNSVNVGSDPVVVNANGLLWQTLTTGGNATGYHSHNEFASGAGGRHHILRPDLCVGSEDVVFKTDGILDTTKLTPAQTVAEAITQTSVDGNLLIDCESRQSQVRACSVVIVKKEFTAPTQDFLVAIDLRYELIAKGNADAAMIEAESTSQEMEAMVILCGDPVAIPATPCQEIFGTTVFSTPPSSSEIYDHTNEMAAQTKAYAIGVVRTGAGSLESMSYGTVPFLQGLNAPHDPNQCMLTSRISQSSIDTEMCYIIKVVTRVEDGENNKYAQGYVSTNGGGLIAVGPPYQLDAAITKYAVLAAGSYNELKTAIRLEVTAVRVIEGLDDDGVKPAFTNWS